MMSEAEKRESRRSLVRVLVTYGAAGFLFVIGSAMILALLYQGSYAEAKDLFLTILPVSAAIVSYWFAGRSVGKPNPGADDTGKHEQPPNDSDRPQH